jgi:4-oxalocrotonate tautomerase
MPIVNVRMLKGRSKAQKDEMSRRITDAISEVGQVPKDAVWLVFEDVEAEDWYTAGVSASDKRAAQAKTK